MCTTKVAARILAFLFLLFSVSGCTSAPQFDEGGLTTLIEQSFVDGELANVLDTDGLTGLVEELLESDDSHEVVKDAPYPAPRPHWPTTPKPSYARPHVEYAELAISDGKFAKLSEKWRLGIVQLVSDGSCDKYDAILQATAAGNPNKFLFLKAQMLVESNCNENAFGGGTDHGLFQVQEPTCMDVGISDDLFDPEVNIKCANEYLQYLRSRQGDGNYADIYTAYNAGPTGAKRIMDPRAFSYVRKIHFALMHLIRQNHSA